MWDINVPGIVAPHDIDVLGHESAYRPQLENVRDRRGISREKPQHCDPRHRLNMRDRAPGPPAHH